MSQFFSIISGDILQGSAIGIITFVRTPTFIGVRIILDMCTWTHMLIFFPYDFLKFSDFFWLL